MFAIVIAGFFTNHTGYLVSKFYLDKYRLDITPSEWTFYTPLLIYMWQAAWLSYGVSTVIRQTHGQFMYIILPILPSDLYIMFAFGLACNVTWLTIWQRQFFEVALIFVVLMTFILAACFYISVRCLADYGNVMTSCGQSTDVWYVRILVQNGLAMFATWGSVASLFNMTIVMTYSNGRRSNENLTSVIAISFLLLQTAGWSVLDTWLRERHLRYVFTPYLVVLLVTGGMVSENWNKGGPLTVYMTIVLIITFILLLTKALLSTLRHVFDPLYQRPSVINKLTNNEHWLLVPRNI